MSILNKGQVAVLRTDTLYGLVAKASDKEAVEKVYQLKGRDFTKPCIVLVANKEQIGQYGDQVEEISKKYEKPTTTVVPSTTEPIWVTRGSNTVAYRIPANEELRGLLQRTGPLIAPSANPQGLPPARSIEEAKAYFGESVNIYLDGGAVPEDVKVSQIILLRNDGSEQQLR